MNNERIKAPGYIGLLENGPGQFALAAADEADQIVAVYVRTDIADAMAAMAAKAALGEAAELAKAAQAMAGQWKTAAASIETSILALIKENTDEQ